MIPPDELSTAFGLAGWVFYRDLADAGYWIHKPGSRGPNNKDPIVTEAEAEAYYEATGSTPAPF